MALASPLRWARLAPALLLLAGCASRQPAEYVPPRLDLSVYGTLGIVDFHASGAEEVGTAATREFLAAVHAAQPGTPVLELGDAATALPGVRPGKLPASAIRELAERERADAIWVGEIREGEDSPRFALDPEYGIASASAQRKAKLEVRLVDGVSGATVWSASSERTIPVMAVNGTLRGLSGLHTKSAQEARAILVRDLVNDVTYDMRPRWVQR